MDTFFKTPISPVSVVGIHFLKSAVPSWAICYVHEKFDSNLNSFALTFGRSAGGLVKMAAPSRVLAKTKPKKWVKYCKVCNFIADLSFICKCDGRF